MAAESPAPCSNRRSPWTRFWILLAVLLPISVVISLLTDAIKQARQTSWRVESKNNLKQIGLAMHNYLDSFAVLPPGSISGPPNQSQHSWQMFLIPGIEASPLYNAIDFNRPWNNLRNAYLFREQLPFFLNPAIEQTTDEQGFGLTHYAANSEIFSENKSHSLKDLPHGTSHTVLAGEIADEFPPWGKPGNWRDPAIPLNSSAASFGRPTRDGAQMLMVDGSVRFVSNRVDQAVYRSPPRPAVEHPRYDMDIRSLHGDLRIKVQTDQHGRVVMASGPLHDKMDYRNGILQAKTEIADAEMKIFAGMSELEHLSVHGTQISDTGLKQLENLRNLQLLTISSAQITDAGLKHLEGLSKLKVLNIRSGHLTEAGIARLRRILPQCDVSWSTLKSD